VGAIEEDLNRLIERRAREADEANSRALQQAENAMRYNLAARAERRREWIDFHRDLERLHKNLADEHAEKAAALAAEGGGV